MVLLLVLPAVALPLRGTIPRALLVRAEPRQDTANWPAAAATSAAPLALLGLGVGGSSQRRAAAPTAGWLARKATSARASVSGGGGSAAAGVIGAAGSACASTSQRVRDHAVRTCRVDAHGRCSASRA